MADRYYKSLAEEARELHQEFIHVGFTEIQAIELLKSQLAFAMINAEVDKKQKRSRKEMMEWYKKQTEKRQEQQEENNDG